MEGKNSFILYTDLLYTVEKLTNEQAGCLLKVILNYVNDLGEPEKMDQVLEVAFEPIKRQLKRDLKNWSSIKGVRVEAGRIGGLKSGKARLKQKEANASLASSKEANEAVNVNVNVNEPVNVNKEVAETSSAAWNSNFYLQELLKDKKRHIQIIGSYFIYKKWSFPSKEAAHSALRREVRPAKDLVPYTSEEIKKTIAWVQRNYPDWTLETIAKKINDIKANN